MLAAICFFPIYVYNLRSYLLFLLSSLPVLWCDQRTINFLFWVLQILLNIIYYFERHWYMYIRGKCKCFPYLYKAVSRCHTLGNLYFWFAFAQKSVKHSLQFLDNKCQKGNLSRALNMKWIRGNCFITAVIFMHD